MIGIVEEEKEKEKEDFVHFWKSHGMERTHVDGSGE